MKIAVVGSGISGNSAAWALSKVHDVTVYEKRNRLGGHSATVTVDDGSDAINVDTGFIVFNEQNYPLLTKLFDHLNVETKPSQMTFSVSLDGGKLEWCGSRLKGIFAQRSNIFSPGFLRMLRDIIVFNKRAKRDLLSGALCGLTLDDYLHKAGFSKRLKNDYLVPMTSAIWSTPSKKMLEFPAESLVRFMKNHSLMQRERPKWRTVCGGSQNYVKALVGDTNAKFRTGSAVVSVERVSEGVLVTDDRGSCELFDQVVMAGHSDQTLKALKNPTTNEREILGAVRYTPNDVWLHRDPSLMPKRRRAWAAWNYIGGGNTEEDRDVSVTYWMTPLQGVREESSLFVSLNPLQEPNPDLTIQKFQYDHPLFDSAAIAAQARLDEIQGKDGIWYCGAWTAFGFHEDGLRSGLNVARALGGIIPWEAARSDSVENMPISSAENDTRIYVDAAE